MQKLTEFKDFSIGDTVKIKAGAYGDFWDGRIGQVLEIVILPDFDNSDRIYILVEFEKSAYPPFSSVPNGINERHMLCYWRRLTKDLEEDMEDTLVRKKELAPINTSNKVLSAIEKARCYAKLGKPQEPIEGF